MPVPADHTTPAPAPSTNPERAYLTSVENALRATQIVVSSLRVSAPGCAVGLTTKLRIIVRRSESAKTTLVSVERVKPAKPVKQSHGPEAAPDTDTDIVATRVCNALIAQGLRAFAELRSGPEAEVRS